MIGSDLRCFASWHIHYNHTTHTLHMHSCTTHALHIQAFCVVMHKLAQLLRPQGVDGLEMCNEEAREHE